MRWSSSRMMPWMHIAEDANSVLLWDILVLVYGLCCEAHPLCTSGTGHACAMWKHSTSAPLARPFYCGVIGKVDDLDAMPYWKVVHSILIAVLVPSWLTYVCNWRLLLHCARENALLHSLHCVYWGNFKKNIYIFQLVKVCC